MSATHVNTFAMELQAAHDRVLQSLGEFDAAKEALKAHPDFKPDLLVRLPFEVLYPKADEPKTEVKPSATKPSGKEATA